MSFVDKLRDEIIESQKAQASFARWKMLLVSGFGAAALGLLPESHISLRSVALLILLPWVCVYVDLLGHHSGIRIIAIAKYLRKCSNLANDAELAVARDYEDFSQSHRHRFKLEGLALMLVSVVVSAVVMLFGLMLGIVPEVTYRAYPPGAEPSVRRFLAAALFVSGMGAIFMTRKLYRSHIEQVDELDHSHCREKG